MVFAMKFNCTTLLIAFLPLFCHGLLSTTRTTAGRQIFGRRLFHQSLLSLSSTTSNIDSNLKSKLGLKQSSFHQRDFSTKNRKKYCKCPDDDDDDISSIDNMKDPEELLEDRREALYAMMGTIWAVTTTTFPMEPANAMYGSDAKLVLPDVMQGLSDRATKQCLVESLGNRECLVYQDDEDKFLYKGADVQVLLQRIQTASSALQRDIPPLVESKQWTKITGVLTGPMGQLSTTLTMLCQLADNPNLAKQKAQIVKQDIFAIGSATTNKNANDVLKYQQAALQDLAIFIKSL